MKKVITSGLVVLTFLTVIFLAGFQNSKNEQMRHIVIFKYKPNATNEQIDQVTKAFGELKDKIPGIVAFEHGLNDSPENKNQGFTHVYMLTFKDAEARDTYLPHPQHKQFGQLLNKYDILEDVFVVDYVPQ